VHAEQLLDHDRDVRELFEVVEHEQAPAPRETGQDALLAVWHRGQADRGGEARPDVGEVPGGLERHEVDVESGRRTDPVGDLDGEPGLARAPRAEQRGDRAPGPADLGDQCGEVVVATYEGYGGAREVAATTERARRGERRPRFCGDLVQLLGQRRVGQAERPEVGEVEPVGRE
jgi:hypothetical protein